MPTVDPSPITYRVLRKPGLKHLYLRIRKGEVLVSANTRVSTAYIADFVRSKRHWIEAQLSKSVTAHDLTQANALVYLLGKPYPVVLREGSHSTERESMVIDKEVALFSLHGKATHGALVTLRDRFYKQYCPETITPLLEEYAVRMGLRPSKLSYRHNRSRWGSCSSKNALSLNTRLMMLPQEILRYIIVHELAHIAHKNHGGDFWKLVEGYCPDYKELRRSIRKFEAYM